jgi:uncharacterized protein YbaR (Trm112 family)
MSVSADLLSILACPSPDHAPLRLEASERPAAVGGDSAPAEELVCTFCASRFPIRDGIPVLLADEATVGPNGLGVASVADQPAHEPTPDGPRLSEGQEPAR